MDTNSPEAAAAGPGVIELGGELYAVAQATPADLMEVRRWLKKHVKGPLEMYADLVADPKFRKLPRRVRDDLAREAGQLRLRGEVALTDEMAADMLQQAKHCAYLAWVLLRKLQPALTCKGLAEHITDENASKVFFELHDASGMDSLGN